MSEPVAQEQPPVDIAAMMASQGVRTDDSPVTIPVKDTTTSQGDQPKEPTQAPPAKVETTEPPPGPGAGSEASKTEPTKPEPAATPVAPAPQPVQPVDVDWRELIKKQPEVEVMKGLGLDEKMINFFTRWRGGEDLKDYLEAVSVDYSKMSNEELLRRQLFKEFGSLSAEDFEEVYKMKVTEHYKLDPDLYDEKEVRRGKLIMGIDADKARQEFVKRQQEMLLSKPPEPAPSTAELEARAEQEQRAKDIETYKGAVQGNQFTKEMLSTNLLKIGDGDKAFNLEIAQPNDVLDLLYDPQKWTAKLWNEDGTPNIRKQLILGAIANDDALFFTNLAKHYEKLGASGLANKIENASEPAPGAPAKGSAESADPVTQLAKFGTITSG
jgi:hypothetical protein